MCDILKAKRTVLLLQLTNDQCEYKAMYRPPIRTEGRSHAPVAKQVEYASWIDIKCPYFYTASIQALFVRVDEGNWPAFTNVSEIYLLKSWHDDSSDEM